MLPIAGLVRVARWHDTWEVIGAIATAAAVVVALVGIAFERRRTKVAEGERDDERAKLEAERAANHEAERRRQPLRVVAFPLFVVDQAFLGGSKRGHWRIQIGNYSDAPIFDVKLETYVANERAGHAQQSVIPPGESAWVDKDDLDDQGVPPVALLFFRDVANVHWRREQDGTLSEVDQHGNLV